eukprot:278205-Rhodomonas_salina.3
MANGAMAVLAGLLAQVKLLCRTQPTQLRVLCLIPRFGVVAFATSSFDFVFPRRFQPTSWATLAPSSWPSRSRHCAS